VAGIDGNRHGLLSSSGGEVLLGSGGYIGVGRESSTRVGSLVCAGSLNSLVGVGCFGVKSTVGNDVLEGVVHQTTIASSISVGL
jgi:hypothetical protein